MQNNSQDSFSDKITKGIKAAASKAIAKHKANNRPIIIWENGKMVTVQAKDIKPPQ